MNTKEKTRGRPPTRPVTKSALMEAVKIVGGTTKLCVAVGVSDGKVSNWLYTAEKIPAHHVPKIVLATRGKIRPEELRPDIQWKMP
jgi:DNA-binding transcriptional regulator YdaS (Cro superfamily)